MFNRELLIGITLGLLAAWAYNRFVAGRSQIVPPFPVISYSKQTGVGMDWKGNQFNWVNPSR